MATTNPQSEQLNIIARTNSRKTKTERERRNLEEAKKKVPEVGLEKEEGERRTMREESRTGRRDALLTTLLKKLINESN